VVSVSNLGSKGPGYDPRAVPKSECMLVNICHSKLCLVLSYMFGCCFGLYNCLFSAQSKPFATISHRVYYCAKLRMLCYVHMMICVILYALSCVADIV